MILTSSPFWDYFWNCSIIKENGEYQQFRMIKLSILLFLAILSPVYLDGSLITFLCPQINNLINLYALTKPCFHCTWLYQSSHRFQQPDRYGRKVKKDKLQGMFCRSTDFPGIEYGLLGDPLASRSQQEGVHHNHSHCQ